MKPIATSRRRLPDWLGCLTLPYWVLHGAIALAQTAAPIIPPAPSIGASMGAANWTLRPAAATQKLTANEPGVLGPFVPTPVLLNAVRGQWLNFQFVVTAGNGALQDLNVTTDGMATITADALPPSQFNFYRENFVFVAHPSGNLNLKKLWWPDALIPWALAPHNVEAGQSGVCWVALKIPDDAAPGDYFGELQITAAGGTRRLALTVTVKDAALPAPHFRANAALYYDNLRDWYAKNLQLNFTGADWAAQKKRFYDFLLDYRINAYDLPVAWDDPQAGAYLRDPRVLSVRTPRLDGPDFALALSTCKLNGATTKAYYYWNDEPGPEAYAQVRADTKQLRAVGVRQCVTAGPNATLRDAVDIWCPNVGDFFGIGHLDPLDLARQRALGHETWLYTMVEPRAPYPTWLVDDDGEAIGRYFQLVQRAGASGFVYSMVHGWGPHPQEDITSFAGTSGDGTLVYPAETVGGQGPLPSIRLMLLRDALQQWEMDNAPGRTRSTAPLRPLTLLPAHPTRVKFMAVPCGVTRVPPVVDGRLSDPCWNPKSLAPGGFTRAGIPVEASLNTTRVWLVSRGTDLYIGVRADHMAAGEWIAAELAPEDLESTVPVPGRGAPPKVAPGPVEEDDAPDRLQFMLKADGKLTQQRWTREGHFDVEVPGLVAKARTDAGFWTVEMKLPLESIGYGKTVRFNLARRTADPASGTRITLRARADANDPWLMPLLTIK